MDRVTPGARYALIVLFAINLMNFFDRQIIGGVGEGIRREWGLSDTALGLLSTVFTLLYAVFGLPLGRLSDTAERRRILSGGVFFWSLLTAASGLARVGPGGAKCRAFGAVLLHCGSFPGDTLEPGRRSGGLPERYGPARGGAVPKGHDR